MLMKLEGNFYITESFAPAAGGFSATLELLAAHPVYAGHFPGRAVVPGVFTLTLIRECVSRALGREVVFTAVRECKFVSALLPAEGLKIKLDFSFGEEGRIAGTVTRCDNGAAVLKLKATIS